MNEIKAFQHKLANPYLNLDKERYVLSEATKTKLLELEKLCAKEPPILKNSFAQAEVIALSIAASSTIEGEGLPGEVIKKLF